LIHKTAGFAVIVVLGILAGLRNDKRMKRAAEVKPIEDRCYQNLKGG
jgi:hypothetical protein